MWVIDGSLPLVWFSRPSMFAQVLDGRDELS
jgi:hypothetical protein